MWPAVVFAVEPSARIVFEALAKTLGIADRVKAIQHEGKSDLEASFPRKMKAWGGPTPPRFIVTRDGFFDARDALKQQLASLVPAPAKPRTKIRIVVVELESWYLGSPAALEAAGLLGSAKTRKRAWSLALRDLCQLGNPSQEAHRLLGGTGKLSTARLIGPHLDPHENFCPSFHAFIAALKWAAESRP
jgi:hypothetical protein